MEEKLFRMAFGFCKVETKIKQICPVLTPEQHHLPSIQFHSPFVCQLQF